MKSKKKEFGTNKFLKEKINKNCNVAFILLESEKFRV